MLKVKDFGKTDSGFTLMELLMVTALVAVLSTVIIMAVNPAKRIQLARDAARKNDLSQLSEAIVAYYTRNQAQKLPAQDSQAHWSTDGSPPQDAAGSGWIPEDLSQDVKILPVDPINNLQHSYRYFADPNQGSDGFKIDAAMEADSQAAKNANDGGIDDTRYEVGTNKSLQPPAI